MSPRRTEWIEPPDWIELKTARLLSQARATRYFECIIYYAEGYVMDGFAWDVALAKVLAK